METRKILVIATGAYDYDTFSKRRIVIACTSFTHVMVNE